MDTKSFEVTQGACTDGLPQLKDTHRKRREASTPKRHIKKSMCQTRFKVNRKSDI